jgi:hypothetical protein
MRDLRQLFDEAADLRKAAAGFTGARRFEGGVESK